MYAENYFFIEIELKKRGELQKIFLCAPARWSSKGYLKNNRCNTGFFAPKRSASKACRSISCDPLLTLDEQSTF